MRGTSEKSYLLTAVWYLEVKKDPERPPRIVTTGQNRYVGFYQSREEAEKQLYEKTNFIRTGAYKYVTLRCSRSGRTFDDASLSIVAVYKWNDDLRQYEKMPLPSLLTDGGEDSGVDDLDFSVKEACC